MTNNLLKEIIENDYGLSLNPMKGLKGEFYQRNRKEDIKKVCGDILDERKDENN